MRRASILNILDKECNDLTSAVPIQTLKTLVRYTLESNSKTITEYMTRIQAEADYLSTLSISHKAGADLFNSFLNRLPFSTSNSFQAAIVERTNAFIESAEKFRMRSALEGAKFIHKDCTVLLHSYSRVTILVLKCAYDLNINFNVKVTTSSCGQKACDELLSYGISATVVPDLAVGVLMDGIDLVLVGAEGVVRNGGVINQIGTFPIALVAHHFKTPFYCACETFKFVDYFPLDQHDLKLDSVDYTPPEFITYLFTNEGVLTTSSVADNIFKRLSSHPQ